MMAVQHYKITFHNKPNISGREVDKIFDERRVALSAQLEDFIATHSRFANKDVGVTFATKGISSLIAILETSGEKLVLKIPLSTGYSEGEALFLKTWEKAGVKVPHVYEEGMFGHHPFVLMQFIDAQTVEEKFGMDTEKMEQIYFEAGKILRDMHKPKATGFGLSVEGKGEYGSFKQWLNSADMKKREDYIKDHGLLNDEKHGSYDKAKEVLIDRLGSSDKSSYCHFDYSTGHLFATEPPTVFDPNPFFNHGYIDLGKTLVNYIAVFGKFPQKLLQGYEDGGEIDAQVLHAAIFVNIVYKLPYQHQQNRTEFIENFHKYLAEQKSILK